MSAFHPIATTRHTSQQVRKVPISDTGHEVSVIIILSQAGFLFRLLKRGDQTPWAFVVTPIDYKRGRRPHVPEGAYEPERVQAMLLEENGYRLERVYALVPE